LNFDKGDEVKKLFFIGFILLLFMGCSEESINVSKGTFPKSLEGGYTTQISLFELNNYTDIPDAGMRAANILGGVLQSHGYYVIIHHHNANISLQEAQKIAKNANSPYFIFGGVSEWRYKTGIDGDPAVSLRFTIYSTDNLKMIWSATGSKTNTGYYSLGTTAQELINNMLDSAVQENDSSAISIF